MKNDLPKQSINQKEESILKRDKILYEKFLIIGDKETGKSSLIQNIFTQDSYSIISDSMLSNSATNINKNNE